MTGSIARPDLPVLTSLRFWAAVIVVLNHLDAGHLSYLPQIVSGWCQSGYEAVTFFFGTVRLHIDLCVFIEPRA